MIELITLTLVRAFKVSFLLTLLTAHGTNVSSITSLLNDANIVRDDRDSRLSFLGADASITGGFQDSWLDTADAVLGEI